MSVSFTCFHFTWKHDNNWHQSGTLRHQHSSQSVSQSVSRSLSLSLSNQSYPFPPSGTTHQESVTSFDEIFYLENIPYNNHNTFDYVFQVYLDVKFFGGRWVEIDRAFSAASPPCGMPSLSPSGHHHLFSETFIFSKNFGSPSCDVFLEPPFYFLLSCF